jgi:hypothetical protein
MYKKLGPDDFAHSTNYALLAARLFYPTIGTKFDSAKEEKVLEAQVEQKIYDPVRGSQAWLEESFEKAIMEVAGNDSGFIVPAKKK